MDCGPQGEWRFPNRRQHLFHFLKALFPALLLTLESICPGMSQKLIIYCEASPQLHNTFWVSFLSLIAKLPMRIVFRVAVQFASWQLLGRRMRPFFGGGLPFTYSRQPLVSWRQVNVFVRRYLSGWHLLFFSCSVQFCSALICSTASSVDLHVVLFYEFT